MGNEGDLILGTLDPKECLEVLDHAHELHRISAQHRVLAVLGNRESSTHVNGGVPKGGMKVQQGRPVYWIAGESGMVGELFKETTEGKANPHKPEKSAPFICLGLLYRLNDCSDDAAQVEPKIRGDETSKPIQPVNVLDFALPSVEPRFVVSRPILCVAATAAEAGKTTLACKLVKILTEQRGLKVGVIKTTGTGGIKDSMQHRAAGATVAYDQVSRRAQRGLRGLFGWGKGALWNGQYVHSSRQVCGADSTRVLRCRETGRRCDYRGIGRRYYVGQQPDVADACTNSSGCVWPLHYLQ